LVARPSTNWVRAAIRWHSAISDEFNSGKMRYIQYSYPARSRARANNGADSARLVSAMSAPSISDRWR